MWTHSQRRITSTRPGHQGQGSENSTCVCVHVSACVSSMRKLFASLDQFGQTNLNHSHSNEPIRKYTAWPLNLEYLPLLWSSSVQNCAQQIVSGSRTYATAAAARQLQRGVLPPPKASFQGQWVRSSLLQVPPAEPSCAAAHTFIWEWRIRPTRVKTTTKYALPVSRFHHIPVDLSAPALPLF